MEVVTKLLSSIPDVELERLAFDTKVDKYTKKLTENYYLSYYFTAV